MSFTSQTGRNDSWSFDVGKVHFWKRDTDEWMKMAPDAFNNWRRTFGRKWGLHPHFIQWMYMKIVRPIHTYGALVCWMAVDKVLYPSCLSRSHLSPGQQQSKYLLKDQQQRQLLSLGSCVRWDISLSDWVCKGTSGHGLYGPGCKLNVEL